MSTFRSFCATSLALTVIFTFVGCESGPATEPVKGKVTANGAPVTGGSLTFAPLSGQTLAASEPMTTDVKSDGTFALEKGAVAGKHRVIYTAPAMEFDAQAWDGKGEPPRAPESPFDGMKPKETEIEIKSGANDLTIDLVKS